MLGANDLLQVVYFGVEFQVKKGTSLVVRSGGRGRGNLFTAIGNHVATLPLARANMFCHGHEQVSKSPAT